MNPEWWTWVVGGIALILAELAIPSFFIVWFGLGALLVADDVKALPVSQLQQLLASKGAMARVIAPRVGSVTADDGKTEIAVDASMEGEPGFLFDAVVLPQGDAAIDILMDDPNVLDFVKNIYRHGKTIVAFSGQHRLLEQAGVSPSLPVQTQAS